MKEYTVECLGCDYKTGPMSLGICESASEMHVMLGKQHTCVIVDSNHVEVMRIHYDS